MKVGLWRKLSAKELTLLNCGIGEDSWESLGLQGNQTSHPKGNQSWIFIGRTDAEAEATILDHLMQSTDSLEKTLGKIEGRRRGWQRMRGLDGITDSMDMSLSKLPEFAMDREARTPCSPRGCKELDMTEWLNWTESFLWFLEIKNVVQKKKKKKKRMWCLGECEQ